MLGVLGERRVTGREKEQGRNLIGEDGVGKGGRELKGGVGGRGWGVGGGKAEEM